MPGKLQTYMQMAKEVQKQITGSFQGWTGFLETAARLYKYPYAEQIMIHAQRPDATACAEYDFWNERMGRYVRRGSKGIALIDNSGNYPRLRYVFDVSDTGRTEKARTPYLWKYREGHANAVSAMLENRYDVDGKSGLPDQLERIAAQLADEYWNSFRQDILGIVDDSFSRDYDESAVGSAFRSAATVSITYTLLSRCDLGPDGFFEQKDFLDVLNFHTPEAAAELGTAVSRISGQLLREIEVTIKKHERDKTAERSQSHDRTELHEEWGLPDSRPDIDRSAGGNKTSGQVWETAEALSSGAQAGAVQPDGAVGGAVPTPAGDRRDGEPETGTDDAGADEAKRRDGGIESKRSDEMGRADEQPESAGGGNDPERAGVQLTGDLPEREPTQTPQPQAALHQLSLFPTENEQIAIIAEAESYTPSAFSMSISQEDLDHILRMEGNADHARMKIAAEYSKGKSAEELATFLKNTFHGGNGVITDSGRYSVWYAEDGIHIANGDAARYLTSAKVVSWQETAARIGQLLEQGKYATNVELAEAPGHERMELAQSLWYLYHDLSEEAAGAVSFSSMENIQGNDFPAETRQLSEVLADPVQRDVLLKEYSAFMAAYARNPDVLRFHHHKPRELWAHLSELSLPRREYLSDMTEPPAIKRFITEDEIAATLASGSGVEGGKRRIYTYFRENHSSKEYADFLKNEYGIGGRSHAVSGATHSAEDHSGKGISLEKQDCPEVQMSWLHVARRISELIRKDRFLTAEEMAQYARFHKLLRPLSQADIDDALRAWNGDIASKRAVVRYMQNHARDRDTAAWLSREYGGDENKNLFAVRAGSPETVELPWTKVQKRISQLIEADDFYTDRERDNRDAVDPAAPDRDPFMHRVTADAERITQEGAVTSPVAEASFPYAVGDTVYLEDGKPFVIDNIGAAEISLRDPTLVYPVFRAESKEGFARLMERFPQPEKAEPQAVAETAEAAPGYHTETVAVYPAAENRLPHDVVIETLHIDESEPPIQNFRITDERLGEGGPKAKFNANTDAIRLLKELERNGRQATPEQQEMLSRYVGWGGLADVFDESKENWNREYHELKDLLTPEEYTAARASTLNAHYTSPTVIRAIYDAVENMGFQTGNILEPSMGVGNFFGMLPESMASSKLYGVELDSITGRIARQLYPKANITVAGFETTDRKDFFDLAVGNVPFGQYQVSDRAFDKLGFSIHNYFFAKALDQVRPGGVVAFVTSRYTMDAKDNSARKYIAQRADFLGAIRLPNNAFKANAGTEVVSDIIFLQKRDRPIDIEPDWMHLGENADGFTINSYFVDNPEMVLGRQTADSTQYGRQDFTVEPIEGLELKDQLADAAKHIRGTYTEAELPDLGEGEALEESIPADPDVKNFSYAIVDGEVYYRQNSIMLKPDFNVTAKERAKGMVELRDCVHKLIAQQMDGFISDETIRQTQTELNILYDSFTSKYGLINSRANALAFADDSSYYLLCSLEELDEDKNLKRKADMFTKRTIKAHEVVTSVDTASEALALSISEKACVDMEYMSSLTGKDEATLASELRGVIYKDYNRKPDGSYTWRTADDFLSGNVREKLAYYTNALELLEGTDKYEAVRDNVEALKTAQPKDLDASEIEIRLGATWIDPQYIREFMWEAFETPFYQRRMIDVNYSSFTAEWHIKNKSAVSYSNIAAYMTYGTERANAYKILEDTLNLRDVRIYDTRYDADGREQRVLNSKETTLAQQKQQAIKEAFRDWIWKDPERRHELVTRYNELFNSTRPREYDGSHITFTGMNPEIQLREHQLNAVAHVLYGGNTLLAHEVGAGKTFEMVAAAMESKRLGLCHKSLFVVPNHLTEQWSSEFLRLYPSANILVATRKDFEPKNRKKFCARIATGEYDAVIIGHSQFEKIPVSTERQQRLLEEQIYEVEEGLRELKEQRAERFTIKSLERTKRGLETKLKKLQDSSRKDDVVTFEQLGVDRLYVDEAHNYKNLFLYTKMRNVAGLSTTDAQKSSDMLLKCRYIDEITESRGIVFATGTPVSNSMTELYTMMRYLQHDAIRSKGLAHFDCWASTFGETQTAIELAPEGTGYRARTRFAKFFNLPELMTLFKEAADIKTADQLDLPTPTPIYHNEVAQPTEIQKEMVQELSERAAKVHAQLVDPSTDNMLKITSDGRKLGLDQRIINPDLPDDPNSKVNLCVNNIVQVYEDGNADRLTQLVFCDLSTPKAAPSQRAAKTAGGILDSPEMNALERLIDSETPDEPGFTVYDDIREKLVARGIPRDEIAFIHEANTEARKKELFAKVRNGQVRVLMGSTFKMGAGMNVQDRLVALHDLDCPWRPGDLEQRSGRIIRQGNKNKEVHIYRYVTESTFDAYLWQTVENKQKFISQIMTSKSPVRSCEDVDETALSYAEIKALCAGDSRIKEKMDLDVDVARLKLMKANHRSQQFRLEDSLLKTFPEQIRQNESFIDGFTNDMKTLSEHQHPKDGFAGMEVKGDLLTDKDNAGAAILEAFKDAKGMEPVPIGSYRGFAMSLTVEDFGREFILTLKGKMNHRVTLGKDARGNLTRIDNALNAIPERMQAVQDKLTTLRKQVEAAKAELGKPFPQEEELRVKSARLAELNTLLNIENGRDVAPAADEPTEKPGRSSVLQRLSTPVPAARTVAKTLPQWEAR